MKEKTTIAWVRVLEALEQLMLLQHGHGDGPRELQLHVAAVQGRKSTMSDPIQRPPLLLIDAQKDLLALAIKDDQGQPAVFKPGDPVPSWSSSNPNVITLEESDAGDPVPLLPTPDPQQRVVRIGTTVGQSTVTVIYGGITEQMVVTIQAGAPASLNLSAGTPVPITPPPAPPPPANP